MTLQFQEQVLKYLLQFKEGKKYVGIMDNTCFEQPHDKIVFDMLSAYVTKFDVIPSKTSMLEWFDREAKDAGVKEDVYNSMTRRIKLLYEPVAEETQLIRFSIVEFTQRLQTKHLFISNVDKVASGDEKFFMDLYKQMTKITKLHDDQDENEKNRGGMLLRDHELHKFEKVDGVPTDLKGLNRMTAAKGFYTPQLVVLMGAPKSFKTGTLLNIALGYVRDGLNVYYADTENGIGAIRTRSRQAMLHCERGELKDLNPKALEVVEAYKRMGGDMEIDFFPARSKTLDDVDENLTYLWDNFGWKADLIIYDYLDLFEPVDKSVKEPRFKIQNVYHHAVRLNNKWDTFAITVSPVGRKAVSKEVINMSDFAEDFAKAYNCHAAFAICQTDDEIAAGIARIVPVAQRDGAQYDGTEYTTCYIRIEHARMLIEELTKIQYDRLLDEAISGRVVRKDTPDKGKGGTKLRNSRRLKDE